MARRPARSGITVEPHALYTCSEDLLKKKSKALADRYGVPLALHLLETKSEREGLVESSGAAPCNTFKT